MASQGSQPVFASPEVMRQAMRIALDSGGAPLVTCAELLASACVVAAALHPEWAAEVALHASADLRALAGELVAGSRLRRSL